MPKPDFVDFDTPPELAKKALEALTLAKKSGRVKKGIHETTKTIERGHAKLVVIAEDVDPPEITMFMPALCDDRNVPFIYVESKADLGKAVGVEVPTAAAAIVAEGKAKDIVADIVEKVKALRGK